MNNPIFAGIDVGGSTTTLYACTPSDQWRDPAYQYEGPGANLKRVGLNQCANTILSIVADLPESDRPVLICAGVAGASTESERRQLERAIGNKLRGEIHVVPDARLALETAFPGESGVAIVAGTGSIVYGRTRGDTYVRAGGWGGLIGDEGSGYQLGLSALRAIADAIDGGPTTQLQQALSERGVSTRQDILDAVYADDARPQELAPLLLECASVGDDRARALLHEQVARLADQATWIAQRHDDLRQQLCGFGGLMNHPTYRDALQHALQERLPSWTVNFSTESPARGALYLATRLEGRSM